MKLKNSSSNPAIHSQSYKSLSSPFRTRSWPLIMVLFAAAVNGLLFFSLSWLNKLPRHIIARQSFSALEVFPVELPPPPLPPQTNLLPTVAENITSRTETKTTEVTYEPTQFTPRMADWLPQLPLIQVPLTLQTIEISTPPQQPLPKIAQPAGPMQLFQVDQVPQKISGHLPAYPYWARVQGVEGVVILRFVVDVNGNVGKVEIDKVVGDKRFAEKAADTVAKWTFSPAIYNSTPVAVWCIQRIQFKLD